MSAVVGPSSPAAEEPVGGDERVVEEFRAGRLGGARLLLLTTGGDRTTPLGYLPDGARRLVLASGGGPSDPEWFLDLRARPRVTVEDGVYTYEADAVILRGEERDEAFARAAEADPGLAAEQARTGRTIPVVALTPAGPMPDARPWGDALRRTHDGFRRELALVRAEIAASGTGLGAQLRVNCLTVCQSLGDHHAGENGRLFPFLAERRPELAPVLERLRADHRTFEALLADLRALAGRERTDGAALLAELDRLTAGLEAHLDREEDVLVPLLNAMTP